MLLMIRANISVITLKGKKRGTYAYLSRIPAGVDWEQYIDDIAEMRNEMVVNNPSPLALTVNGKEYNMWYKKAADQFNIVEVGGDTISMEKLYHYAFNSKGLYLLEPFDLDEAADYQWFRTNQEEGQSWAAMTLMNGVESFNGGIIDGVTVAAGRPLWFFNQQLDMLNAGQASVGEWAFTLDENDMDANSLAAFQALDELLSTFTERKYSIVANYDNEGNGTVSFQVDVTLRQSGGRVSGWLRMNLDRVVNESSVALNFNGNYEFDNAYKSGFESLIESNPEVFANVASLFSNMEFNVEFDSYTNLRTVILRNANNPENWYRVETDYIRR